MPTASSSLRRDSIASESDWARDIAAEIAVRWRPGIVHRKVHILNLDSWTRRRSRALKARRHVRLQRSTHVLKSQVFNLELRTVTLAREPAVAVALRNVEALLCIVDPEVAHSDIAHVAEPAAAAVGRSALGDTSPGFGVSGVVIVHSDDVADGEVFDGLVLALKLADRA